MSAQYLDAECPKRSARPRPERCSPTPVLVLGADRLSAEGTKALLWREPTVELVHANERNRARVLLVVTDDLRDRVVRQATAIQRDGWPGIVVVASGIDRDRVDAATGAGILGVVHRAEITRAALAGAIRRVDPGRCHCPTGVPPRGAGPTATISPPGPPASPEELLSPHPWLSARDREILRLLADGRRTDEVAEQIAYSESTIKVALARIMDALGARNRCEAVARALRLGIIR